MFWNTIARKLRKQFHIGSGNGVQELDPFSAYELWASSYDEVETNALVTAEQSIIRPILAQLPLRRKKILDACCGTGRYLQVLMESRPQSVSACDVSTAMLERARLKVDGQRKVFFDIADLLSLPYKKNQFDFVLCTLALDHLPDLSEGVNELSRVTVKHGSVLVSLFHPYGKLLGWKRTFKNSATGGATYAAAYHYHTHVDYLNAFRSAGLTVEQVFEPLIDDTVRPYYVKAGRAELYERYKGIPIALIFLLKKK